MKSHPIFSNVSKNSEIYLWDRVGDIEYFRVIFSQNLL